MKDFFIKFEGVEITGKPWQKVFAFSFNLVSIPAQVFGWVYLVAFAVNVAWG